MKIVTSIFWVTTVMLVFFCADSFAYTDEDTGNECPYDVCENRCDWEQLKKEYVNENMKRELESMEQSAAEAGAPFIFALPCLVDEWACRNGFTRDASCQLKNVDQNISIGLVHYNNFMYPDGPEPMPTQIPESSNKSNIYNSKCQSGEDIEKAELFESSGMQGYFYTHTIKYVQPGGDCGGGYCDHQKFSAHGNLRGDRLDINVSGGQSYHSAGCFATTCRPTDEDKERYRACLESVRLAGTPVTSSPAEVKTLLSSLAAYLVTGSEMFASMVKTGQVPEPGDFAFEEDGGAFAIAVRVDAEGYSTFTDTLYTEDFTPSTITLRGLVKDVAGSPVPGAMVSLPGLDAKVQSGPNGHYRITADAGGSKPFGLSLDLTLEQVFKNIEAKIVTDANIYANGRPVDVELYVKADGKPYRNKPVHVIQAGIFKIGERETGLVTLPKAASRKVLTDTQGRATVRLFGPRVLPGKISPWSEPMYLFPMQGFVELRGEWDSTRHVMATYEVHDPFPRIAKTSMTHNVEEETWQIRPSRIWIDDPDSEKQGGWRVTVTGPGDFKVRYGKVHHNELYETAPQSPFAFHFRPPKIGYNLQDQPDLWGELLKTNMEALKNVYLSILENDILKNSAAIERLYKDMPLNNDITLIGKDHWLSKSYAKVSDYLDAESGNKVFSALGSGDRRGEAILDLMKNGITALDRATDTIKMQELQPDSDGVTSQKVFASIDYALNMADSITGFLGMWDHNTYTEVAKLLWENSKTIYSVHAKNMEINNAILDEKQIPLTITVEDELGHATKKIVMVNALIWVTNN